MTTFTYVKIYDEGVGMAVEPIAAPTPEALAKYAADDLEWAEMLCGQPGEPRDVDGRVTLNTDPAKAEYFLVWHMDDGTTQVDYYRPVIEEEEEF